MSSGVDEFLTLPSVGRGRRRYPARCGASLEPSLDRDDGKVFHACSAYARGFDALWGACQWLDRAPPGRNEDGYWWRLHDEYDRPSQDRRTRS